jgi:hypothetical protein
MKGRNRNSLGGTAAPPYRLIEKIGFDFEIGFDLKAA